MTGPRHPPDAGDGMGIDRRLTTSLVVLTSPQTRPRAAGAVVKLILDGIVAGT